MDLSKKLKLDTIIAEMQAAQAKYKAELQVAFTEVLKEFFEANPDVTVIKWAQYTPYWNDGEQCEFGVHSPIFSNAKDIEIVYHWGDLDIAEDHDEYNTIWIYGDNAYGEFEKRAYTVLSKDTIDAMNSLNRSIQSRDMEGILEDMFGDHVIVTVTPTGASADDYDHD